MLTNRSMNYGDYLQLNRLLDCQQLMTEKTPPPAHDEMLFIIIHQTYELWFKQILFELNSARQFLSQPRLTPVGLSVVVSRLQRVVEIQKILVDQIRVIETMSTLDFLEFRDHLIPASGFQSLQFRLIETCLGVTSSHRMEIEKQFFQSRLKPEERDILLAAEKNESVFLLIQQWLERMPFSHFDDWDFWAQYSQQVQSMLLRDKLSITENPNLAPEQKQAELTNLEQTRESFLTLLDAKRWGQMIHAGKVRLSQKAALNAVFIHLYRDWPAMQKPYQLLNLLVEIDQQMTTWRWRHAIMVQRILGSKIGTGGSTGSEYLKNTTERNRVFTDFFNLSTFLIQRKDVPKLPDHLAQEMGFLYEGT